MPAASNVTSGPTGSTTPSATRRGPSTTPCTPIWPAARSWDGPADAALVPGPAVPGRPGGLGDSAGRASAPPRAEGAGPLPLADVPAAHPLPRGPAPADPPLAPVPPSPAGGGPPRAGLRAPLHAAGRRDGRRGRRRPARGGDPARSLRQ